jgi:formyltetrahydrofolate-dependent phosphoribosylglycinamide formyltransferase
MTEKIPVAVLVSGRGSNLRALIDAAAEPEHPARIVHVVSDRPEAPALGVAREAGIATTLVEGAAFAAKDQFDAALGEAMRATGAHLFCLAGFMRILGADLVTTWEGRILNIHPSLLPSFRGLDTHRRALEAGVRIHGATVHVVTPTLDEGPIVAQAAVPVLAGDDEASLAERVLAAEHKLYPAALAVKITGTSVTAEQPALFSPPL